MIFLFITTLLAACSDRGSVQDSSDQPCGGHEQLADQLVEVARVTCEADDRCAGVNEQDPDNQLCIVTLSSNYDAQLQLEYETRCVDYCALDELVQSIPERACEDVGFSFTADVTYLCDTPNFPPSSLLYPPEE